MSNILDIKDSIGAYTFYATNTNKEQYFCKCGNHFEVDAPSDELSDVENLFNDGDDDDGIMGALNSAKISLRDNIKCPHCNVDYKIPVNQKRLREIGKYFLSGYNVNEDNGRLTLNKVKVKPLLAPEESEEPLEFEEIVRHLSYEIETGKLFFKDYKSEEIEFDLDQTLSVVSKFFENDTPLVVNLFDLHNYIMKLSNYVSDSENIDTVKGLLEEARSNMNKSADDTFEKVLSILLSIIKYSNLSTIAMTKSPIFLYEMLRDCNPPKAEVLEKEGVTSPIKIFNFLAKTYINRINEEVKEEKIVEKEFTFSSNIVLEDHEDHSKVSKVGDDFEEGTEDTMSVSEGETRELKINLKSIQDYESKVSKTAQGNFEVFQIGGDGQISKFIYKKLKAFHDYKQLVKYMKHFEYKNLVELMTKYDYDLIVNMIDVIYYRLDIDMDEVKRLIPLFIDHCQVQTKDMKIKTNTFDPNEELTLDYTYINSFNFEFYDDCKMMIKTLEFDPRKDLYKIKTNAVLKAFHDEVVKYYGAIKLEEEGGYKGYFNNFKFLEDKNNYDGLLRFEIIDTPKAVVAEGRELHHSVSSYAARLMDGDYVLLRVYDDTEDAPEKDLDRFTMGLHYNKNNGLEFDQLKGVANKPASDRVKKMAIEWMKSKEVNYNEKRPDIRIRR